MVLVYVLLGVSWPQSSIVTSLHLPAFPVMYPCLSVLPSSCVKPMYLGLGLCVCTSCFILIVYFMCVMFSFLISVSYVSLCSVTLSLIVGGVSVCLFSFTSVSHFTYLLTLKLNMFSKTVDRPMTPLPS